MKCVTKINLPCASLSFHRWSVVFRHPGQRSQNSSLTASRIVWVSAIMCRVTALHSLLPCSQRAENRSIFGRLRPGSQPGRSRKKERRKKKKKKERKKERRKKKREKERERGKREKEREREKIKSDYKLAPYLSIIKDHRQRKLLTKYSLSEHSLCVETGRHKQSWRARELRLCSHCTDDELHFLTECSKYKHIRDAYFKQIALVSPEFQQTSNTEKLWYIWEREGKVHPPANTCYSQFHPADRVCFVVCLSTFVFHLWRVSVISYSIFV